MRGKQIRASAAALAVLVAGGTISSAEGAFVPVFQGTSPSSGDTVFTYDLSFFGLGGLSSLQEGDFITFYDVPGFVSATTPSGDFTISTSNVGPYAFMQTPTDDPGLTNITFEYNGSTVTSDQTFGGAQIVSSFSFTNESGLYSSEDAFLGSRFGQTGLVTTPAVPEPTTGLAMIGGAALLLRRWRA